MASHHALTIVTETELLKAFESSVACCTDRGDTAKVQMLQCIVGFAGEVCLHWGMLCLCVVAVLLLSDC